MFVSENEGPKMWRMIAPFLYYYVEIFFYLVLPIIYILWVGSILTNPAVEDSRNVFFSWIILYMYICLG
jgi:hypothetical protein